MLTHQNYRESTISAVKVEEFLKGDELEKTLNALDRLIAAKTYGSPIHNSVQELLGMKNYFVDPASYYEQVKNHMIEREGRQKQYRNGVSQMEIPSGGGLRFRLHMPPEGDVRKTTPKRLWRERPDCWSLPAERCVRLNQVAAEVNETSSLRAACGHISEKEE